MRSLTRCLLLQKSRWGERTSCWGWNWSLAETDIPNERQGPTKGWWMVGGGEEERREPLIGGVEHFPNCDTYPWRHWDCPGTRMKQPWRQELFLFLKVPTRPESKDGGWKTSRFWSIARNQSPGTSHPHTLPTAPGIPGSGTHGCPEHFPGTPWTTAQFHRALRISKVDYHFFFLLLDWGGFVHVFIYKIVVKCT